MTERMLVAYDGSACADHAVEQALRLASEAHAVLFVLALAPELASTLQAGLSPVGRLTDDLIAFARAGRRMGVDVDGSYLEASTESLVRQVLATHRVDHLIVARCGGADDDSRNGRLLKALVDDCPVAVTIVADGARA